MAWELLAGALPWGTKSGANLIAAVLTAEPAPLASLVAGIEPHVSDETATRWNTRVPPRLRNFIWIYAYAMPAETRADATTALAKESAFEPLPPYTPLSLSSAAVGRTFLLAGRYAEAKAALERATRSCFPLDHPIEHTRAYFDLGAAREATGDIAGACAAYGVVKSRWGEAKPKSLTANAATARIAALKCSR